MNFLATPLNRLPAWTLDTCAPTNAPIILNSMFGDVEASRKNAYAHMRVITPLDDLERRTHLHG